QKPLIRLPPNLRQLGHVLLEPWPELRFKAPWDRSCSTSTTGSLLLICMRLVSDRRQLREVPCQDQTDRLTVGLEEVSIDIVERTDQQVQGLASDHGAFVDHNIPVTVRGDQLDLPLNTSLEERIAQGVRIKESQQRMHRHR